MAAVETDGHRRGRPRPDRLGNVRTSHRTVGTAGVGAAPASRTEAVAIEGGVPASSGGVGAGGGIEGDIHTGDYYDVEYDPTGLSEVRGFPRFLMVLGIFIAFAGFALFAYPILMASSGCVTDFGLRRIRSGFG